MSQTPKSFQQITLFIIFLNLFLNLSCSNPETANANLNRNAEKVRAETEKSNPARDNLEELLDRIQLPELPDEVVWREESGEANAARNKMIAVLKYNNEAAARLTALVEKNRQPEQVEIGAESWFPEELTAQAQMSGNEMLKGTAYGANQFLNIPYGSGRITRVENTNYFVLELTAQ
jgi:hypothetical protein